MSRERHQAEFDTRIGAVLRELVDQARRGIPHGDVFAIRAHGAGIIEYQNNLTLVEFAAIRFRVGAHIQRVVSQHG